MTTCSAIVGANNSRAAARASAQRDRQTRRAARTATPCRARTSECTEVHRQPSDFNASRPARSGDLSEPTQDDSGGRRNATTQDRIGHARGVATRCSRFHVRLAPVIDLGSRGYRARISTSTLKPCELRNSTNQRPILPAPRSQRTAPEPCHDGHAGLLLSGQRRADHQAE